MFMFYTFFRSAPEEGFYCKPKYQANLFKYILLVLAIIFFVTSAVRISLPSIFCILAILLIQVYKRSGTTHRFVAVVLQILFVFEYCKSLRTAYKTKANKNILDIPLKIILLA